MVKKIKVLQVTTSIVRGGTEAYIMNNYLNIDHDEFHFDFYLFEDRVDAYQKEINELGGKIIIGASPNIMNLYRFIKLLIKCNKENGPYDVVHAHTNFNNAWVLLAAYLSGVKNRISHSHTSGFEITQSKVKENYNRLKRMIINKLSTSKIAASTEAGIWLYGEEQFQKNGTVLRNGISVKKIQNVSNDEIRALKKSFNLLDNQLVFGNITRFDNNKNQEFVLDIFKEIKLMHPNSILLLGGNDGGKLQHTLTKVEELGLKDVVQFIGVRADIEVCLKLLDAYIFPSYIEGLGIAALESQAAGTPIFSSDTVPKEVDIGVGLIHFLSLDNGPEYWAKYILTYLKSINRLDNKRIEEAFESKGFSIEDSVKELEYLYSSHGR